MPSSLIQRGSIGWSRREQGLRATTMKWLELATAFTLARSKSLTFCDMIWRYPLPRSCTELHRALLLDFEWLWWPIPHYQYLKFAHLWTLHNVCTSNVLMQGHWHSMTRKLILQSWSVRLYYSTRKFPDLCSHQPTKNQQKNKLVGQETANQLQAEETCCHRSKAKKR